MSKCFLVMLLAAGLALNAQDMAGGKPEYSEAIRVIEAWLDAQIDYQQIPGISAAIVKDQALLWSKGFGVRDLETGQPASEGTIYSICSISKLFTAIGILQLRDKGMLDLDDDIHEHLPWLDLEQAFPGGGPITIRALLTHSSGVPRDAAFPYWADPAFPFPSKVEFRESLSSQKTLKPASDAHYQYSNLGMSLLGLVIGEISGLSYEDYVGRHILGPLKMKDTRPSMPEDEIGKRLATGYGVLPRDGSGRPELAFFQAQAIAPAAGFSSTVKDLAHFASWNFRSVEIPENPILNGNTLKEMQRINYVDPLDGVTRGLGYGVYQQRNMLLSGHAGECPGYYSQLKMDMKSKWGVVVMLNTMGVSSSDLMYGIFSVLNSYDRAKAVDPAGDLVLEDYAGTYFDIWDGENIIVPWKGRLAVFSLTGSTLYGPGTLAKHVEGDRFLIVTDDGSPGPEISFDRNGQGQVTKYRIHSFYMEKIR